MPDIKMLSGTLKKLAVKYKYLLIIVLVGLILLMLPIGKSTEKKAEAESAQASFDLEAFERRIENILESSEGVGRVKIALAMKSGMESVYAEEARVNTREQKGSGESTDRNQDSDRRPSILSNGSGGETPVMVKQVYPEFLGATIVCDGAENPKVRLYITDAVSSLTGITSDRITVIKMKN